MANRHCKAPGCKNGITWNNISDMCKAHTHTKGCNCKGCKAERGELPPLPPPRPVRNDVKKVGIPYLSNTAAVMYVSLKRAPWE